MISYSEYFCALYETESNLNGKLIEVRWNQRRKRGVSHIDLTRQVVLNGANEGQVFGKRHKLDAKIRSSKPRGTTWRQVERNTYGY